ncbi:FAD/NAD-P-binding domain-containing protein, partial [Mycena capillaripes]
MPSTLVERVPTCTDMFVIGGRPAGLCACTSVTLLEKGYFPRYHIHESMLPSCRPFLNFIGAEEKVANHGFSVKVWLSPADGLVLGAAVNVNQYKREGYTDFISPDPNKASWNVARSEFDEIFLRHAVSSGATVCEGVQVTAIQFSFSSSFDANQAVHISADRGSVRFESFIDGSGRIVIISTKYLNNRKFNQTLRNIAYWAQGCRGNVPYFEALTVSVDVVMKEEASRLKKSTLVGPDMWNVHYLTHVLHLLGSAQLGSQVKSSGDYSSSASHYAGPSYRIAGDAGANIRAYIDPFFPSGVHLSFTNGLSAASTIVASIRGHCTEAEAVRFHNEKTGTSYTRFLLVVLSVYCQLTVQAVAVLSNIDEDNFDCALDFLQPGSLVLIQGAADADQSVTEQSLQRTMKFCEHAPGHAAVAARVDASLLARDWPIMEMKAVAALAGADEEAKQVSSRGWGCWKPTLTHVLWRVNTRKAVEGTYNWEQHFLGEDVDGFAVMLERGQLGLRRFKLSESESEP